MKKNNIDITVGFVPRNSTNPNTIFEHLFIEVNGVKYHVQGDQECRDALKTIANLKNVTGKELLKTANKLSFDSSDYSDKIDELEDESIDINSDKVSKIVASKVNSNGSKVVRGLLITTAAAIILSAGGCHLAKKLNGYSNQKADETVIDVDDDKTFEELLESLNKEQKMFVSESVDSYDDITVLLQKMQKDGNDVYKFYNQISTEEKVDGEIVKYNTVDLLSVFAAKIFYNADYYSSEDVLKYTGGDKSVFTGISSSAANVTVQLLKKYDSCSSRDEMPDLSLIIDNERALEIVNHFIGRDGYLGEYIDAKSASDTAKMNEIRSKVSKEIHELDANDLLNQKNLGVTLALQVIANNFELSNEDSIYLLGEPDTEDKGIIGSLCDYIQDRVELFEDEIDKYNDKCSDYETKKSDLKRELENSGLIANWFNKNEVKLNALDKEYQEYVISKVGENSVKLSEINALFCKEKLIADFNMDRDEAEKLSQNEIVQKYYDYLKNIVEVVEPGYVQAIEERMNQLIENTYKNAPIQNGGGKPGDTVTSTIPQQQVTEDKLSEEQKQEAINEYEQNGGIPSDDRSAIEEVVKPGEALIPNEDGGYEIITNTKEMAIKEENEKALARIEELRNQGYEVYFAYDEEGKIFYEYSKVTSNDNSDDDEKSNENDDSKDQDQNTKPVLPDKIVTAENENGEKITDPDTGEDIKFNPSEADDFKNSQNSGTGKGNAGQNATEPPLQIIEEDGISGTNVVEQPTVPSNENTYEQPTVPSNENDFEETFFENFEGGSFDGTGAIDPNDLAKLADEYIAMLENMANEAEESKPYTK